MPRIACRCCRVELENVDPELAPLAHLPLSLRWNESLELKTIGRDEVAAMSDGHIEPQQK